jgi:hypothetical protein
MKVTMKEVGSGWFGMYFVDLLITWVWNTQERGDLRL